MAWFALPAVVEAVSLVATGIIGGTGIALREAKKEKDSLKAIESGNQLKNEVITMLEGEIPETFAIDILKINLDIERLNTERREQLLNVRPRIDNIAAMVDKNTINKLFDEFNSIIDKNLNDLRKRIDGEVLLIFNKIVEQKSAKYKSVKKWVDTVNENTLTYLCDTYVNNTAIELNKKIKDKYDKCERVLRDGNNTIIIRLNDTFLKLKTDFTRTRIEWIALLNNR
jgi:hypothetical protein